MVKIRDKKFGKVTDVAANYAAILCKMGKHEYVVDDLVKAMVPEPVVAPPPISELASVAEDKPVELPPSRLYETRAFAADDSPEKPKRKYTRRDLAAED